MRPDVDTDTLYEYRYQVTKDGRRVGSVEAQFRGRAVWQIEHPDFVDPGEPRTMERLDEALYAAGFEVMPDE
jgi:hypothetical protein